MRERLSAKTFIPRAIEIHGDKYDYSQTQYIKAKEPVTIICKKHGPFTQRPQDHILKACGCPKCKGDKTVEVHSYTKEKFLELAKEKHGDKYNYSQINYVNYTTPVKIICPIHGEFEQKPSIHVQTTGCQKCGREKANQTESYTFKDFVDKANKVHFDKYDYRKVNYINSQTKVTIICPEHGEFEQRPASHLFGQGCPKCRLVGQTKLYNKLKESFPKEEIIWEANKNIIPWIENQRIDIYFPSINLGVELMGPQHYEEIPYFKNGTSFQKIQELDTKKRQKCKENNCILIDLKYYYTKADYQNLVNQIQNLLYNTQDRTNLIEQVQ